MPSKSTDTCPPVLKPYRFHGLNLNYYGKEKNLTTDCPWCGREGKFVVQQDRGIWRCLVCSEGSEKGGGNSHTFIRTLFKISQIPIDKAKQLQVEKHLRTFKTLTEWGVRWSPLTNDWVIPGYDQTGKLNQLYRYRLTDGKRRWLPTPEHKHQLFGVPLYRASCETVFLCEGPWDGMALWEALPLSIKEVSNVLAVPGTNTFFQQWTSLFAGKKVVILYDNDYPHWNEKLQKNTPPAGHSGVKRVVSILVNSPKPPTSIEYLNWGPDGHSVDLPDGHDVRDFLSGVIE